MAATQVAKKLNNNVYFRSMAAAQVAKKLKDRRQKQNLNEIFKKVK